MYRTDAELRRACTARQSEVLNIINDHRFLAPATLAARERLETELALQALLRDGGEALLRPPSAVRRWLGARVIRLGAWLSGPAVPIDPSPRPTEA
jgi:hypothetical protein